MELEKFEQNIEYKFKNKELIKNALTHTSYANENNKESNEKLEFLGDAILEFITSKFLYTNYFKLKEGEMTKVRAEVVCEDSLYNVALKHNFSDFLYLGKSEKSNKSNKKITILADSVEAVIAAIFLDSNFEETEKFVLRNLKESIEKSTKNVGLKDYKTVLQERLQQNGEVKIEYKLIKSEGPDHNKTFTVSVSCNNKELATGTGHTKKNAEMQAAQIALETFYV